MMQCISSASPRGRLQAWALGAMRSLLNPGPEWKRPLAQTRPLEAKVTNDNSDSWPEDESGGLSCRRRHGRTLGSGHLRLGSSGTETKARAHSLVPASLVFLAVEGCLLSGSTWALSLRVGYLVSPVRTRVRPDQACSQDFNQPLAGPSLI